MTKFVNCYKWYLIKGSAPYMDPSTPRRRPAAGGYARGTETRQRIIEAAIEVFGEDGYARASTRQIAQRAGVNPPALQYYFDSKEGLHLACAEHIVEDAWANLGPVIEHAEQTDVDLSDRESLIEAVCSVLDTLADYGLGAYQAESRKQFMARGQSVGAGPAYDLVREKLSLRVHKACAHLIGGALSKPADDMQVRLRTIAILGQFTTFSIGRSSALASLGWNDFLGARLEQVKAVVRDQTRAILASAV